MSGSLTRRGADCLSAAATIAQLVEALRIALPVIDSEGAQWQSDLIRAAIAASGQQL